jgi:hypothetical protein
VADGLAVPTFAVAVAIGSLNAGPSFDSILAASTPTVAIKATTAGTPLVLMPIAKLW